MNAMVEQRTEQWFNDRAGMITGSMMHAANAFTEGGEYKSGANKGMQKVVKPLKARTDYVLQLAAERLTGKPRKGPKAAALEWGREMEPHALAAYEAKRGVIVSTAGFMVHPDYPFIGASPDFLVDDEGGGEIKCPESSEVHLDTLMNGLPEEHIEQIQGGIWVTGRAWWDFISYHPDFPPARRLYVQRVMRNEAFIERMKENCLSLEEEVRAVVLRVLPAERAF